MPLDIKQELIDEIVKRKILEEEYKGKTERSPVTPTSLNPTIASLLGTGSDAATTYKFLKDGSGTEDTKMYSGLNNDPLKTSLAVAGSGLGGLLLSKLIGKKFPKLGESLLGGMAGYQMSVAGHNIGALGQSPEDMLNTSRINNKSEPSIPSDLPYAHSIAHRNALSGDVKK